MVYCVESGQLLTVISHSTYDMRPSVQKKLKQGFCNFIMDSLSKIAVPFFFLVQIISHCRVMPLLRGESAI